MKIENKGTEHLKIRLDDGKIYDFPPGQTRTVNKELGEAIVKRDRKNFIIVEGIKKIRNNKITSYNKKVKK